LETSLENEFNQVKTELNNSNNDATGISKLKVTNDIENLDELARMAQVDLDRYVTQSKKVELKMAARRTANANPATPSTDNSPNASQNSNETIDNTLKNEDTNSNTNSANNDLSSANNNSDNINSDEETAPKPKKSNKHKSAHKKHRKKQKDWNPDNDNLTTVKAMKVNKSDNVSDNESTDADVSTDNADLAMK